MKLVDANVLLSAINAESDHHRASVRWLDRALGGADTVGFTWLVVTAFLRISTLPVFPASLTPKQGLDQVHTWLTAPSARLLEPKAHHLAVLTGLLDPTGTGGNLVNDAHLAAIAIEHRADMVSYDTDFTRFPPLRTWRPDELLTP